MATLSAAAAEASAGGSQKSAMCAPADGRKYVLVTTSKYVLVTTSKQSTILEEGRESRG
jgi:hypothetical protein